MVYSKVKEDIKKKAGEKTNIPKAALKSSEKISEKIEKEAGLIDSYEFSSGTMPISINIARKEDEFVPIYEVSIASISKNTEVILEKIREELIEKVNLGMVDILSTKETGIIEKEFTETINTLIRKYFPDANDKTTEFLTSYLIQKSLGMGSIEILLDDKNLEEVAINNAQEPVWVYHIKHGWLKTNIKVLSEDQIRHYSNMIGRRIGRQITILEPLMDANLETGDRVNATLEPISSKGNTITLRKFAAKPWTMTDFIKTNTISVSAAALIWLAIEYELSILFTGGTGTGKTSLLNVCSVFFPPNQRIISIEDTRELQLPTFLHWVPMVTRLPNPEGKGEVSMLDLLVNSLRMRPDRVVVGEIRRKREADVLFEAMHTGHSVYATLHADDTRETITRLTNPPIDVPKTMLPAISLIVVMYRNRRTGIRRIFQISEILPDSETNILIQLDIKSGKLKHVNKSKSLIDTLRLFTGFSKEQLNRNLKEKEEVLIWLVKQNINTVNEVGRVMAEYYTDKESIMKKVKKNKQFR
ncbi:CpaF family protein [Candidatus Woesearchaeota archaeon]|nr:CpaF family protein [Candidatus Woesearchaeota archaeon]